MKTFLRVSVLFVVAVSTGAVAQSPAFVPPAIPDDIAFRNVDIYSEGTRMAGDVYAAKANAGKKLPTILMAHGWGGTKSGFRPEALAFAKAGYLVVAFDYRGWGESDSRVVLVNKRAPAEKQNYRFTAEVEEVREVVEPLDMVVDWLNAINWAVGDPQCNQEHIGLWGSSLSGGLVVSVAEMDPRVKAVHSQVPSLDGRWTLANPPGTRHHGERSHRSFPWRARVSGAAREHRAAAHRCAHPDAICRVVPGRVRGSGVQRGHAVRGC
jgi:dienelactone hydrolase